MAKHVTDYLTMSNIKDTGFAYSLNLIAGKYKLIILYFLAEYKSVRFNQLKRYVGDISDKTLSVNLKELANDGLIIRNEMHIIPPQVEYSLSPKGVSLMKIIDLLGEWGDENKNI